MVLQCLWKASSWLILKAAQVWLTYISSRMTFLMEMMSRLSLPCLPSQGWKLTVLSPETPPKGLLIEVTSICQVRGIQAEPEHAVNEHAANTGHAINWDEVKIIDSHPHLKQQCVLEAYSASSPHHQKRARPTTTSLSTANLCTSVVTRT